MRSNTAFLLLTLALLTGCVPQAVSVAGPTAAAPAAEPPAAAVPLEPVAKVVVAQSDPVPAGSFLFFEDFEQGTAHWELPAGQQPIAWRLLNAVTCGGKYTMLMGQPEQERFGTAAETGESLLTLKDPIDLGKAVRPQFKYDVKSLAYPATSLSVQAEVQVPGSDWQPLGRKAEGSFVFLGSIVTDLTPFVGKAIRLRFRAAFKPTDDPTKGIYLDDVMVIEPR